MHTVAAMNSTAVEANEDAIVDARPLWSSLSTVITLAVLFDLVQLLEDEVRH